MVCRTHFFVEGGAVHSRDTGERVSRKAIATGSGGSVWAVRGNHVVDCRHVDCILDGRSAFYARFGEGDEELTLAIAMRTEKIMGAIQWTPLPGPKLAQANPNSPIVSSGARYKSQYRRASGCKAFGSRLLIALCRRMNGKKESQEMIYPMSTYSKYVI